MYRKKREAAAYRDIQRMSVLATSPPNWASFYQTLCATAPRFLIDENGWAALATEEDCVYSDDLRKIVERERRARDVDIALALTTWLDNLRNYLIEDLPVFVPGTGAINEVRDARRERVKLAYAIRFRDINTLCRILCRALVAPSDSDE